MSGLTEEQKKLIDELVRDCKNPEELLGKNGILKELQKRFIESALEAEMSEHLGYEKHESKGKGSGNSRNGKTSKKLKTEHSEIEIEVPRDRNSEFEPQLVKKRQSRLVGFNEKILYLYSKGLSTRNIQGELKEIYGVEVSPTLISNVTDKVIDDVKKWQSRPLQSCYPIIYFDALVVRSRQEGVSKKKSVYLALGINMEGEKELLGMWINETEGAKFWLYVFNEIHNRGVEDCFIASVDGLQGLPEAIESVFPQTQVQLCIVHRIRDSLKYVPWKDKKSVATDLKKIYGAKTLEAAELELEEFSKKWDKKYPAISQGWRRNWDRLTVYFDYSEEIRKVIYTTNSIESLNSTLRRVLKTKGSFPNDESIMKILYLAIERISRKWSHPIRNWKSALNQFVMMHGERVTKWV